MGHWFVVLWDGSSIHGVIRGIISFWYLQMGHRSVLSSNEPSIRRVIRRISDSWCHQMGLRWSIGLPCQQISRSIVSSGGRWNINGSLLGGVVRWVIDWWCHQRTYQFVISSDGISISVVIKWTIDESSDEMVSLDTSSIQRWLIGGVVRWVIDSTMSYRSVVFSDESLIRVASSQTTDLKARIAN